MLFRSDIFFIAQSSINQTITLSGVLSSGTASGSSTNRLVIDESGSSYSNVVILTNNANSFVANIRVDFGTLATTSNAALGAGANQILLNTAAVPAAGTLRLDANGIDINRQVNVNAVGASVNTNGNNGTISGVLAGTSSLTKFGTGQLVLSNGANTFNGPVVVNGGGLLVNGVLPGAASPPAITVNTGGTIGGTGTVGSGAATRNITVNNGGTLVGGDPTTAAGGDPGVLTVNGNILIGGGSNFRVRITGGSPSGTDGGSSGGTPTDPANNGFLFHSTGTLTLNATANIVIDGTGVSFTPNQQYSYLVAQSGSASSINVIDDTVFQTIGFTGTNFSLIGDGTGNVYLAFTPVPEPVTVLGLAAGALGLSGLVRHRLRSRLQRA